MSCFQEYLAGVTKRSLPNTFKKQFKLFCLRVVTNLVVLMLTAGAGAIVYFLSQEQESYTTADLANTSKTHIAGVSLDYAVSAWVLLIDDCVSISIQ